MVREPVHPAPLAQARAVVRDTRDIHELGPERKGVNETRVRTAQCGRPAEDEQRWPLAAGSTTGHGTGPTGSRRSRTSKRACSASTCSSFLLAAALSS